MEPFIRILDAATQLGVGKGATYGFGHVSYRVWTEMAGNFNTYGLQKTLTGSRK
jgi:hypothetical protein